MEGLRSDPDVVIPLAPGRLGSSSMHFVGDRRLLDEPIVGLLASTRTPPDLTLPTLDLVRAEAGAETIFMSGFQSPLERECLGILLACRATVVVCPARALQGMRLPTEWKLRLDAGEMLVLSMITAGGARRPTVELGQLRTRTILELARSVLIPNAQPGSRTYSAAAQAIERRLPVYCFDHPRNRDLLLLGATPLRQMEPSGGMSGGIPDRL